MRGVSSLALAPCSIDGTFGRFHLPSSSLPQKTDNKLRSTPARPVSCGALILSGPASPLFVRPLHIRVRVPYSRRALHSRVAPPGLRSSISPGATRWLARVAVARAVGVRRPWESSLHLPSVRSSVRVLPPASLPQLACLPARPPACLSLPLPPSPPPPFLRARPPSSSTLLSSSSSSSPPPSLLRLHLVLPPRRRLLPLSKSPAETRYVRAAAASFAHGRAGHPRVRARECRVSSSRPLPEERRCDTIFGQRESPRATCGCLSKTRRRAARRECRISVIVIDIDPSLEISASRTPRSLSHAQLPRPRSGEASFFYIYMDSDTTRCSASRHSSRRSATFSSYRASSLESPEAAGSSSVSRLMRSSAFNPLASIGRRPEI